MLNERNELVGDSSTNGLVICDEGGSQATAGMVGISCPTTVQVTLAKRIVRSGSDKVFCLAAQTSVPLYEDELASVSDLGLRLSDGTSVVLSLSAFNDRSGAGNQSRSAHQAVYEAPTVCRGISHDRIYDPARYEPDRFRVRGPSGLALLCMIAIMTTTVIAAIQWSQLAKSPNAQPLSVSATLPASSHSGSRKSAQVRTLLEKSRSGDTTASSITVPVSKGAGADLKTTDLSVAGGGKVLIRAGNYKRKSATGEAKSEQSHAAAATARRSKQGLFVPPPPPVVPLMPYPYPLQFQQSDSSPVSVQPPVQSPIQSSITQPQMQPSGGGVLSRQTAQSRPTPEQAKSSHAHSAPYGEPSIFSLKTNGRFGEPFVDALPVRTTPQNVQGAATATSTHQAVNDSRQTPPGAPLPGEGEPLQLERIPFPDR